MSLTRYIIETLALTLSLVLKIPLAIYQFWFESMLNSLPVYMLSDSDTDDTASDTEVEEDIPFYKKDGVLDTADLECEELQGKIVKALDIIDICRAHGFKVHEHVVQTNDGYLLAIHRIIPRKITMNRERSYSTHLKKLNQHVVYFHHGLLTNSELFVLGDKTSKCLPFILAENGFDVWLGNNRGNKYSRKHLDLSASSFEFWNYSLDEYAMYDIPNTIDYILEATSQPNLTYIGFSQGSAQCLAALSLSPKLNDKINLFIGLSPAMIPKGLSHPVASFFVNSAQSFLFRLFGQRAILPSVVFWQQLMGETRYKTVVDKSLVLLFGWNSSNISEVQKTVGYQHMFSPSSVKSVVHWLQIIKAGRFQMYDEGGNAGSKLIAFGAKHKAHRVAPFPTQTIFTPMLLIYGESDSLIDIDKTLDNLSCPVETIGIKGYEHMDTLWAHNVSESVFEPILKRLKELHGPDQDGAIIGDSHRKNSPTYIENRGELNIHVTQEPQINNRSSKLQIPIIKSDDSAGIVI